MASSSNVILHQSPKEIIMVRPGAFGFDEDTMASNAFQKAAPSNKTDKALADEALEEFEDVVSLFKRNGITVVTFNDSPHPRKPDAIFPNNWFSTHPDGTLIIYPMMAESRRLEQRPDIVKYLEDIYDVLFFKYNENDTE
jgi:hypothetical protein